MVVDDDENIRKVLAHWVAEAGHTVKVAADADAALQRLGLLHRPEPLRPVDERHHAEDRLRGGPALSARHPRVDLQLPLPPGEALGALQRLSGQARALDLVVESAILVTGVLLAFGFMLFLTQITDFGAPSIFSNIVYVMPSLGTQTQAAMSMSPSESKSAAMAR